MAGKRVKCPCGQVMTAPLPSEPPAEDVYDLAEPPPKPPAPLAAPAPAEPAPRRLPHAPPARMARKEDGVSPEKLRDVQVPLLLLAVGLAIQLVAGWLQGARSGNQLGAALLTIAINTVGGTILMLISLFIVARIRGIKLGPFGVDVDVEDSHGGVPVGGDGVRTGEGCRVEGAV